MTALFMDVLAATNLGLPPLPPHRLEPPQNPGRLTPPELATCVELGTPIAQGLLDGGLRGRQCVRLADHGENLRQPVGLAPRTFDSQLRLVDLSDELFEALPCVGVGVAGVVGYV